MTPKFNIIITHSGPRAVRLPLSRVSAPLPPAPRPRSFLPSPESIRFRLVSTILGLTLALGFFVRSCIRNCILELEESTEEKKGKNGENI